MGVRFQKSGGLPRESSRDIDTAYVFGEGASSVPQEPAAVDLCLNPVSTHIPAAHSQRAKVIKAFIQQLFTESFLWPGIILDTWGPPINKTDKTLILLSLHSSEGRQYIHQ